VAEHNNLGKLGEELARKYLEENGYNIRHYNWFFGKNEIDIIAETKDEIVICEVKTRSSLFEAQPHETVTIKKQKFLIKAADYYLNYFKINKETRFDIITVIYVNNIHHIDHLKNAFYPTL